MKILIFNSSLSRNSGVMSVIMNYYKNINKDEVQFDFLYFYDSDNSYINEIKSLGGQCFKISNPKNVMKFRKELGDFLSCKKEYSIIHNHDAIFACFMYKILKKNGIKNVIVHSHATKYSDKKISELRNKILCKKITKYADTYFACSFLAGRFMFKNNDFYVMKNAIDTDKYRYSDNIRNEIRNKLNIDNKYVIGHAGRFQLQKNHTFLLDIFKEYLCINPNSILLLIGDGPLFDKIKQKAYDIDIYDKILFLGKRNDMASLYCAMDIFLLPSLYEGLPMVGVEAQCSGLPALFSSEISDEVEIGEAKFISLSDTARNWAREIENTKNNCVKLNRNQGIINIQKSGYDIAIESKNLVKKYKELMEE